MVFILGKEVWFLDCILRVENLSKKFNGNLALNNMNFNLKKGEIHGIIGANGSGKSTFMNILFGSNNIKDTGGYKGNIFIDGKQIEIKDTYGAINEGIGMVHQELALINDLDISGNVKINRENIIEKTKIFKDFALVDQKKNHKDTEIALSKIGITIDPRTRVRNLSTNLKQFVEIAREIDNRKLKILMLDEPTSSLNVEETKILLSQLEELTKIGVSIIFVSHRLEEVVSICNRITVLKDGSVVRTYNKGNYNINQLALDMIGKDVVQVLRKKRRLSKKDILSFKSVELSHRDKRFKNIALDVKQGEILGITGLAGHGQESFGYGLMGLYNMSGEVRFKGEKITPGDTPELINKGIYLLPDDRKEMSLLINNSIWENIVFESYDKQSEFIKYPRLGKLSPLNYKKIYEHADKMIEELNIKVEDRNQVIGELSGGNQQKVCIGRAITINPEVLFIGEPTRGIDVYSKEIILEMLLKLNEINNTTIVISSGEISELKRVCDRIIIMYENQVFKIFEDNFDGEEFNLAISGREVVQNEE